MRIKPGPLFLLQEPHYHAVRVGSVNRFRGFVLALEGPRIDALRAAGKDVAVHVASDDVAAVVNHPHAAQCRFDFEMRYDAPFEFVADGEVLWRYEPPRDRAVTIAAPLPPPEIVEITQGGRDVAAYRDAVISGHTTMKAILDIAPRDILDIGCGTGRLLLGWHAEDRSRHLTGVDIDERLIRWDREHLADVADWRTTGIEPPLPFAGVSFDLIQLVSVFTHLPLHLQRAWTAEVRRLLRPNGRAIVTLHGDVYARLLLDEPLRHQFELDGHVTISGGAVGSNSYASFHTERFARELFDGFEVTRYERGPRNLFPIATFQDVYLLTPAR